MEELSFPIGKYIEQPFSESQLKEWLLEIEVLPIYIDKFINEYIQYCG